MRAVIRGIGKNAQFWIDGKMVSEKEFWRRFPPAQEAATGPCSLSSVPKMVSSSVAVHPDQVEEAVESAKRKGVPTEFQRDGRPVFTSRAHQRRYLKAYAMHNNDDI